VRGGNEKRMKPVETAIASTEYPAQRWLIRGSLSTKQMPFDIRFEAALADQRDGYGRRELRSIRPFFTSGLRQRNAVFPDAARVPRIFSFGPSG